MAVRRHCAVCGAAFAPDVRAQHGQKYCSPACAKVAKVMRDRRHKRRYRQTGLGIAQRKKEGRRRRKTSWAAYIQAWRRAHRQRARQIDREAARKYYRANRRKILRKRRRNGLSNGVAPIAKFRPIRYRFQGTADRIPPEVLQDRAGVLRRSAASRCSRSPNSYSAQDRIRKAGIGSAS